MSEYFSKIAGGKKKILPIVVILAVILFLTLIISFYYFGSESRWLGKIRKNIPLPAVIVGFKKTITIKNLEDNRVAVKRFYENQDFSQIGSRIDFSTPEGFQRLKIIEKEILNKMIENEAIKIIAKKNGVRVSLDQVEQNLQRKIEEVGDEKSLKENLSRLYGWNIQDFINNVIWPSLYNQKLEKAVMKKYYEEFSRQARKKINEAEAHLKKEGNFAQTAKLYSEGLTADEGGDMGWVVKSQLMAEISTALEKLAKDEVSGIIESPLGFHLIKLEDEKIENNIPMYKLRQIIVRKTTYPDWLSGEISRLKIYIPLREYEWNRKTRAVEFSDPKARDFEKKIREKFPGDASILF